MVGQVSIDNCQLVDPCKRPNACKHGGKCSIKDDKVHCDCNGTGYIGKNCHFGKLYDLQKQKKCKLNNTEELSHIHTITCHRSHLRKLYPMICLQILKNFYKLKIEIGTD